MIDWPQYFPKYIPGFSLKPMVASAIRSKAGYTRLLSTAQAIYDLYSVGGHYRPIIQRYLDICLTIDSVKRDVVGWKAPTETSNLLCRMLSAMFAEHFPSTEEAKGYIKSLYGQVEAGNNLESWYLVKLHNLSTDVQNVSNTRAYARGLILDPATLYALDATGQMPLVQDLRQEVSDLMGRLAVLRRYGVKSCYFQDGLAHHKSDAWVFYSTQPFAQGGAKFLGEMPLAMTGVALRDELKSLKVSSEEIKVHASRARVIGLNGARFIWSMYDESEFSWTIGLPFTSVRKIFDQEGRTLEYEVLRSIQAMRLFDLVTAVEVVDRMPALTRAGALDRMARAFGVSRREGGSVLMLRRVEYLQDGTRGVDDLEKEVENAERETRKRAQHEVVGFIRRLPVGRRCSPDARQMALQEIGVELKDGETYVRSHTRGRGQPEDEKLPRAVSVR